MGGRGKNMKKRTMKSAGENSKKNTFEKLKKELFQEAYYLATACATQVMIVLFSKEGKLYTFGYPNVDCVMQRFLNPSPEDKVYKFGYPNFDAVMQRYLNLKSVSNDDDATAKPYPQRRSVEEIFNNRVSEVIEMIKLGKSEEDMPVHLLRELEALSSEEYKKYNEMLDQLLAVLRKKIAEKKNKLEASKMINHNV